MYLTNEKKINYSLSGAYYTRKWNDYCSYTYFEKVYGGHGLLKKAVNISKYDDVIFHSSMIQENQVPSWESAGWVIHKKLFVCDQNLRFFSVNHASEITKISQKKLDVGDFSYLLDLDKEIFESYWRNSFNSFQETLKSCVNNYLFIQKKGDQTIGYAILGETRRLSYLQRIGVDKLYQKQGYGEELLKSVLSFSKKKKFLTMKLNTQEENESALKLYKKNGFNIQKNKLVIMTSTQEGG
ncbi:GNAT family N-acetyltransferase [Acidimicrobiia bacterium]|nr:GNAT family N-acetyltransferase [Acidimicrobiia bacterium]